MSLSFHREDDSQRTLDVNFAEVRSRVRTHTHTSGAQQLVVVVVLCVAYIGIFYFSLFFFFLEGSKSGIIRRLSHFSPKMIGTCRCRQNKAKE